MDTNKMDGELVIKNAEAINKSFPHFFKVFESLGGKVLYED
jgi:5-enolpyruvylshikimate-3-phosphate synthase